LKPTIGQIVIYHPLPDDEDGCQPNGAVKDLPAIIVAVWSDTYLNLKVITDGLKDTWVTSVSEGTGPRNWSWPERI
jgi:hypothetical protein